jgi:uncharacterized membrane protein
LQSLLIHQEGRLLIPQLGGIVDLGIEIVRVLSELHDEDERVR